MHFYFTAHISGLVSLWCVGNDCEKEPGYTGPVPKVKSQQTESSRFTKHKEISRIKTPNRFLSNILIGTL